MRLYNTNDIDHLFDAKELSMSNYKVYYATISGKHQKEDLERQIQDLCKAYSDHEVIGEVASGIN